jgi:N-carbamoyl-L-amino-acid hydrolase
VSRRETFAAWFEELAAIGLTATGGWQRFAWTPEDRAARAWFERTAAAVGLDVESDRNGNLWAWWRDGQRNRRRRRGEGAVVTGSHLDTVAEGGAYDGALGVVSGLLAVDELRTRHPDPPPQPIAVVAFADEEGARFNLPCCGSRLLTGALDPADVLDRTDLDGTTLRDALSDAGVDPQQLGTDAQRLEGIGNFVELHVEQGRGLADLDRPLAVATAMWPHGRWRLVLTGEANHAGTTRLVDRRDPVLVAADAALAARQRARMAKMVATVGRMVVEPNSPNSVASRVTATLDARAADDATLDRFVEEWLSIVRHRATHHDVVVELECDARTIGVEFDPALRERIAARLAALDIPVATLPTAAGHDAGILAPHVPSAMLFVRNPTGASHTPSESASVDDCLTGVTALAAVLEDLAWA